MKEINWNTTVANKWVQALNEMNKPVPDAPYFMLTPQWEKKNLHPIITFFFFS